ncbi:MAG: hypothetical protein HY321_07435 [Armatimonadetes bacterium]|nr:hypothetical protein [Armatimonadota bacterium]
MSQGGKPGPPRFSGCRTFRPIQRRPDFFALYQTVEDDVIHHGEIVGAMA